MGHLCSLVGEGGDVFVQYVQCEDGQPHTGAIAVSKDVMSLAMEAEYQGMMHDCSLGDQTGCWVWDEHSEIDGSQGKHAIHDNTVSTGGSMV